MKSSLLFASILTFFASVNACIADEKGNPDVGLYKEIAAADADFFEAFNKQDLKNVAKRFTRDLEFYHDKGGVLDYDGNMQATEKLFANNPTLKRQLIEETLAVYPIKDFGALATGEHRFCHLEDGKQDCGQFKFMTIWRKEDGVWKMARVVSYDH
ncbi:MAG: hypothetical protein B0W54_12775 [Cellvibrio sp. 79]|nr:MAG: hypothetical protein B0W54_12775 [Cellvibrio sp. 79]